jgi:hypothetical protein
LASDLAHIWRDDRLDQLPPLELVRSSSQTIKVGVPSNHVRSSCRVLCVSLGGSLVLVALPAWVAGTDPPSPSSRCCCPNLSAVTARAALRSVAATTSELIHSRHRHRGSATDRADVRIRSHDARQRITTPARLVLFMEGSYNSPLGEALSRGAKYWSRCFPRWPAWARTIQRPLPRRLSPASRASCFTGSRCTTRQTRARPSNLW